MFDGVKQYATYLEGDVGLYLPDNHGVLLFDVHLRLPSLGLQLAKPDLFDWFIGQIEGVRTNSLAYHATVSPLNILLEHWGCSCI